MLLRPCVFWLKAKVLESFRAWGRGCTCHEEQRRQGKRVQCKKAGRNAKGYKQRLLQLYGELMELSSSFLSISMITELGGPLCADGQLCVSTILGHLRLKFAWVFQPPFTIWNCEDPEEARKFIQTTKDQIARGDTNVHRVSCRFVLEDEGCMGAAFEAHAQRQGLDQLVGTEITCYLNLGGFMICCLPCPLTQGSKLNNESCE